MKKNKLFKLFIMLFLVISLSGCTKVLKDENKKVITNEKTGQSITENILCRPTDKKTIEIYEKNNVDIKDLSECKNMKITGKYEGLWTTFFVRPLAFVIVKLGTLLNSSALALLVITIIIRLILFPLTRKSAMQSENIKNAQPELARLEKKYENKTDQESSTKKAQEMMMIYKKYKISPLSGCIFALIQMPLLFAFIEAINRTPAIFEETFLGLQMGTTPWVAITGGKIYYLVLPILIIITTYFSFKMNGATGATGSPDAQKQTKMMMNIMTIFIGFMSFTLSTAIGIYWIVSSAFTVAQNLLTNKGKKKNA